jgi:transposase
MLHLSPACSYYLYRGDTDMRKGFDSLCGIVTMQLQMHILNGAIFIFMNKKHNQVKLLLWEGDGIALYHKRLEKGTYELPVCDGKTAGINISNQQLQLILQGISLKSVRRLKRYQQLPENGG